MPHVLTRIAKTRAGEQDGRVEVRTQPSTKAPWNGVRPFTLDVPREWIAPLHEAGSTYPFAARPAAALIPLDGAGNLIDDPATAEPAWAALDATYRRLAGPGRGTPRTLIERLDYHGALRRQTPAGTGAAGLTVVYPKSGDVMRAARLPSPGGITSESLYRLTAETADEARYLVALLNAPCLREAFAASRASGRDFHNGPWKRLPIPRYDESDGTHRELARLCAEGEAVAAEMVATETAGGQVAVSRRIRLALADAGIAAAIDACARNVLPRDAAGAADTEPAAAAGA